MSEDDAILQRLIDGCPTAMTVVDAEGVIRWAGGAHERLSGWRCEDLVGTNVIDLIDTSWNPIALDSIGAAMTRSGLQRPMLFKLRRKDGSTYVAEVQANSQWDDPVVNGMAVYVRRWDERVLIDAVVESVASGADLRTTLNLLAQVMGAETLEGDGVVLFGREREQFTTCVAAESVPDGLRGDDGTAGTPWNRALITGEPAWSSVRAIAEPAGAIAAERGYRSCWAWPVDRDDDVVGCLVLWRNEDEEPDHTCSMVLDNLARLTGLVLEHEQHALELQHAAMHDALTGLPNRARFFEHLRTIVADGPGPLVGVLYVDLDEFKPVNDRLGHAAGDRVLQTAGRRLEAAVRESDLVARLGGDEFAIACHGVNDGAVLEAIAERVTTAMREPMSIGPQKVNVGSSVGVAFAEPGACSVDALVEAADGALYAVKESGRGAWRSALSTG